MRAYDTDWSKAAMPADRVAAQPWLIPLLFAPFAPRDGGPTAGEWRSGSAHSTARSHH